MTDTPPEAPQHRRVIEEPGQHWSRVDHRDVPWTLATETDEWRKLKSDLRIMGRAAVRALLGVDEDAMRGLETQADELQATRKWRDFPGRAHVVDVWAVRDIASTPPTLSQVLADSPFEKPGIDPESNYAVVADGIVNTTWRLNPAEVQARACLELRKAIEGLTSAKSAGAEKDPKARPFDAMAAARDIPDGAHSLVRALAQQPEHEARGYSKFPKIRKETVKKYAGLMVRLGIAAERIEGANTPRPRVLLLRGENAKAVADALAATS